MKGQKGNTRTSKALSWLLRHHAREEGLYMDEEGNVRVNDILKHSKFVGVSVNDIQDIVESDSKQRFTLQNKGNELWIRANQGHSINLSSPDLKLIENPEKYPTVVHGTYSSKLESIISSGGLCKMNRTHIHFAPSDNTSNVISGMRGNCNVLIYIDMAEAMKDGFKFYESANGVILCSGNENGILPKKYFKNILKK